MIEPIAHGPPWHLIGLVNENFKEHIRDPSRVKALMCASFVKCDAALKIILDPWRLGTKMAPWCKIFHRM